MVLNPGAHLGCQQRHSGRLKTTPAAFRSRLTKSVALEVGGMGIRVNAAAPGPIQTGMLDRSTGSEDVKAYLVTLNAQKRIGQPDEIAQAIQVKQASFTGHILTVDSGKSAG